MTIIECPLRQECSPETFLSPGARRRPSFLLRVSWAWVGGGGHLQGAATGTVEAGRLETGLSSDEQGRQPLCFLCGVCSTAREAEKNLSGWRLRREWPSTNRNVLCRGNGGRGSFNVISAGSTSGHGVLPRFPSQVKLAELIHRGRGSSACRARDKGQVRMHPASSSLNGTAQGSRHRWHVPVYSQGKTPNADLREALPSEPPPRLSPALCSSPTPLPAVSTGSEFPWKVMASDLCTRPAGLCIGPGSLIVSR